MSQTEAGPWLVISALSSVSVVAETAEPRFFMRGVVHVWERNRKRRIRLVAHRVPLVQRAAWVGRESIANLGQKVDVLTHILRTSPSC